MDDTEKKIAKFAAAAPDESLRGRILSASKSAWEEGRGSEAGRLLAKFAAAGPDSGLRDRILRNSQAAWNSRPRTILFPPILRIAAGILVLLNIAALLLFLQERKNMERFVSELGTQGDGASAMKTLVVGLGVDAGYADTVVEAGESRRMETIYRPSRLEDLSREIQELLKTDSKL